MNVVIISHQGKFSFIRRIPLKKTTTNQNAEGGAPFQWIYIENTLKPRAQGTLWNRKWNDFRSQRIRACAVKLSPCNVEAMFRKDHQQNGVN